MKPWTPIFSLLAALGATTAGFVGCGGDSSNGAAHDGTAGSAGKSSTSGSAGADAGGSNDRGGTGGGGSSNSGGSGGELTCRSTDCGPALGIPSTTCADGSTGGPTGRCLRLETGGCGWEVRECPVAGEGGASGSGGAAAAGAGGEAGGGGVPSSDRCGGCTYSGPTPQICIYQAGGPGPGRFVCAKQNPCGAAGACACIVDQGTCNPMLEGGSPGYCVCDNGLD